MGTRNLTAVMLNGKYVVAQYGQWDGDPSGQGATALSFCKEHLQTPQQVASFQKQLSRVHFLTDTELKEFSAMVGSKTGGLNENQFRKFNQLLPLINRDLGAEVLKLILDSTDKEILLKDSISFAGESLFCEYAYVIDLDKKTFEAFKGFQKSKISSDERFFGFDKHEKGERDKYYPVALVKSWDLSALPTMKEFCAAFGRGDED